MSRKKILYWSALTIYVMGTLILTTMMKFDFILANADPLVRRIGDLAHFVLLGGFAFLSLWGLNLKNGGVINWREISYWTAFFFALFFGGLIELLQNFTPSRTPSWHDVFVNAMGIVAVLTAVRFYSRRKRGKTPAALLQC